MTLDAVPNTVERDLARAEGYRLLAWGLVFPDEAYHADMPEWLAALAETLPAFGLATGDLAATADESLRTLQIEYTRLFINAIPKVPAPPYASAYAETRQMMGDAAQAAIRAYRAAGVNFSPSDYEMPDQLTVELEFMFYLIRETLLAQEAGDQARADRFQAQQRQFVSELLAPWLAAWRADVVQWDRVGFYAALAHLIEQWIQADLAYLLADTEEI